MHPADPLKESLRFYRPYADLPSILEKHGQILLRGVPGLLKALVISSLVESGRRVLWISPRSTLREIALSDLRQLVNDDQVGLRPAPHATDDITPFEARIFRERALQNWTSTHPFVLVTEPSSTWLKLLPPKDDLDRIRIALQPGTNLGRDRLAERLVQAGYSRHDVVENRGEYALRGHILDLFPYTHDKPLRLEYWGNRLESLRSFDPLSQRTIAHLKNENLFLSDLDESTGESLEAYLLPDDVLFIEEPDDASLIAREMEAEESWRKILAGSSTIFWGSPRRDIECVHFKGTPQEESGGNIQRFTDDLAKLAISHNPVHISCENEGQLKRFRELLSERDVASLPHLFVAQFSGGFRLPDSAPILYTDHQIFRRPRRRRAYFRLRNFAPIERAEMLKGGDYVVHENYGIGCFMSLKTIKVGGHTRECLHIEYKGNTSLYVRLESLLKVQKYSGREGFVPPLTRIGSGEWDRIRRKARKAVKELAGGLLKLYAKRATSTGFAFPKDDALQLELEARFEFEETPDQIKAIHDVKHDMEGARPMDRLVCADVGYGKTEVALRAAFKAVISGKQVGVLVPTTLLAQQHFQTFKKRLVDEPIEIEMLSRFRSAGKQKEILKRLKAGRVDVIIGTHRLLSSDVGFENLGLLIVDEEHRFGVRHKERIKNLRSKIDVLTLTATPIPRTLHMSLIGARDMSLIQTAPQDRLPIETDIVPFSKDLITEAILREVERGGQIYFVHNRVQSIKSVYEMLKRWLPQVRFAIAHGQMPEKQLESTMSDFLDKKYDCLISTMIIESGLDLPNVNTMIVNRADRFGLAQLYQLRGRIGRSNRQAYAYLLTPTNLSISDTSRKRLDAIRYCSYLGAGYQLAMHDLEIRGAGEIFGAKQSGFIHSVGFDLYQKMLAESIEDLKDDANLSGSQRDRENAEFEPKIDFPFDAFLPNSYVEGPEQRLEIYRRLSAAPDRSVLMNVIEETIDRYGAPPEEAKALFDLMELKLGCVRAGLPKLELHEQYLIAETNQSNGDEWHQRLSEIMKKWHDLPIEFSGTTPPTIMIKLGSENNWEDRVAFAKKVLAKIG